MARRFRPLGPTYPSVGPDLSEHILNCRRELLSPAYRERYDEAYRRSHPLGASVADLRADNRRLRERQTQTEEEVRAIRLELARLKANTRSQPDTRKPRRGADGAVMPLDGNEPAEN